MQHNSEDLAKRVGARWNENNRKGKRWLCRLEPAMLIQILLSIDANMDFKSINDKYNGLYHYIVTRIIKRLFHEWETRTTNCSCLGICEDESLLETYAINWLEHPDFVERQYENEFYMDRHCDRLPWYNFRKQLCTIADILLLETEYSRLKKLVFDKSNTFDVSLWTVLNDIKMS